MLKPDCLARGLDGLVTGRLRQAGFVIEAEKDWLLSPEEIRRCFLHPVPDYVEFLTAGPVRFLLVRGVDPHIRLWELKHEIRRELGAKDPLRNLLHTSDQGTEYHLLLETFFSELDPLLYCNSLDLDLCLEAAGGPGEVRAVLDRLDRRSALVYCAVRVPVPWLAELAPVVAKTRWEKLRVVWAVAAEAAGTPRPMRVLIYLPGPEAARWPLRESAGPSDPEPGRRSTAELAALAAARGGLVVAESYPITPPEIDDYLLTVRTCPERLDERLAAGSLVREMTRLKADGLHGLFCFQPGLALAETELRMDLCRMAGLVRAGGGGGRVPPGRFSVSVDCLRAFVELWGQA